MSHVDEGALHAYLDGALDALPASEASRIRQHLASCEECSRRLEEERAQREEAAAILAVADPGTGAVPPLEELRRRAAARTRSGAGPRLRQLAWAASLVLAVGAGWMLRGSRDPRISQALDPLLREAPEERAVPSAVAEEPDPERRAADEAGMRTVGAPEAGATPDRPPAPAPAPAGGAGASAVEVQAVRERAIDVVVEAEAARADVADLAGADARAPRATPAAPPSMAVSGEARGREVPRALARSQATVLAAREEEAPREALGAAGALSVPGLAVLSMETGRDDLPAGTLRVLQLLEEDTLELLHLPAGVDPSAVGGPGDPGRTQVAIRYGAGWLLGRARASAEVLEALLARVTGGG